MGEAVAAARERARGEDAYLPDQFSNPANPEADRRTTGPEIARALEGRVDVLVAGVGTGGTITGAGGYLRERNARLTDRRGGAAGLGGPLRRPARPAPHPGHRRGLVPRRPAARAARRGRDRQRRGRDRSPRWRCARRTGLLAGISGGAALWAALQVAEREESAGQRIVVIVPDSASGTFRRRSSPRREGGGGGPPKGGRGGRSRGGPTASIQTPRAAAGRSVVGRAERMLDCLRIF